MEYYDFAACFVWLCNLVADIKGEKKAGVHENMELRRTFGPRREELTAERKRLNKE
jgi:hypothetical protein